MGRVDRPTFDQAAHTLKLISDQNLNVDQMHRLHMLLPELARAVRFNVVTSIGPEGFAVIDHDMKREQLLHGIRVDISDTELMSDLLVGSGQMGKELVLFEFEDALNYVQSRTDSIDFEDISRMTLRENVRLGTLNDLLWFAYRYNHAENADFIIASAGMTEDLGNEHCWALERVVDDAGSYFRVIRWDRGKPLGEGRIKILFVRSPE